MKRWLAWIAVAVGMVARLVWALAAPPVVYDDASAYRALAHSLADGRGYATAAGPTAYWTPGWPAWMSALFRFGAGDRGVAVASVVLGGVTAGACWLLARELGFAKRAPVAAALCALVPSLVLLPGVLLSENLALPLVVFATAALARARRTRSIASFALFGAAAALATWVRESCAVLVVAGAAFACARRVGSLRARGAALAAVALAFALVLAPWVLRNRAAMGVTTLTTSAGPNLCIGLGDGATGGYRKLDVAGHDEVAEHELGLRCASSGLARRPYELVTLAPAKLSRLLVWDDWIVDDFYARAQGIGAGAALALRVVCNLAYWALLGFAALVGWRTRKDAGAVVLAVAGAVALSVLVGFGGGRFHTPLLPLLAVLAARHKCYGRDS